MADKRRADLPARGDVPETGRTVHGRRDYSRVVGAERRTRDAIPAIERRARLPSGPGATQPRGLVPGRREDELAICAERGAGHAIRMADERLADQFAGLGVPQPRGLVG